MSARRRRATTTCHPRSSLVATWVLAACFLGAPEGARPAEVDQSPPEEDGKPTEVRVWVYLLDLVDIAGGDQSFGADVVLVAEWRDPRLAGEWEGVRNLALGSVWHPRLQCVNQRSLRSLLPDVVEVMPSGAARYRQRWSGRFWASMDLRNFPLDRQSFEVQVVAVGYRRDEVRLVPADDSRLPAMANRLSISDWDLGYVRVEEADYEVTPGGLALSGVHLAFEGKRRLSYYGVQIVLPLAMIVLMAWSALWVDPTIAAVRMSVVVTTMLTLIAYRFALGNLVPKLPYLTRLDYFLLGSTALVFATLLYMAGASFLVARERRAFVLRTDFWGRILFPATFVLLFFAVWLAPS
jgi:hypothetical protein